MIKNTLTLITFLISFSLISQTNLDQLFKPRLLFSSQESKTNKKTEIIILETDTLYNINSNVYNLKFLNDSLYSENFLQVYNIAAFIMSRKKSGTNYELKQWNAPIIIYFDKKIPKSVIKEFRKFYSQINGFEHLKISFTSNIEKATYYIKTTSKIINAYNEDFTFDSEIERENAILTGATYSLNTDFNNKFYSGILTINIDRGRTNIAILKQLKQLFFMSLGNFYNGYLIDDSSLLSNDYINSKTISKFDLDILKLHYSMIYPQKMYDKTFDKLIKLSKTKQ